MFDDVKQSVPGFKSLVFWCTRIVVLPWIFFNWHSSQPLARSIVAVPLQLVLLSLDLALAIVNIAVPLAMMGWYFLVGAIMMGWCGLWCRKPELTARFVRRCWWHWVEMRQCFASSFDSYGTILADRSTAATNDGGDAVTYGEWPKALYCGTFCFGLTRRLWLGQRKAIVSDDSVEFMTPGGTHATVSKRSWAVIHHPLSMNAQHGRTIAACGGRHSTSVVRSKRSSALVHRCLKLGATVCAIVCGMDRVVSMLHSSLLAVMSTRQIHCLFNGMTVVPQRLLLQAHQRLARSWVRRSY